MKCKDCKWWRSGDDRYQYEGRCRRNAPVRLQWAEGGGGSAQVVDGWPRTESGDFCGEFLPREADLIPAGDAAARVLETVKQKMEGTE